MKVGVYKFFQISGVFFFQYSQEWNYWIIWLILFLIFEKPPCCFSQRLHKVIFTPIHEGSLFSTSLLTFVIYGLFSDSRSEGGMSHLLPNLLFSDYWAYIICFHVSVCLLWRNVYSGVLPIFLIWLFVLFCVLILSCMSCLYISDINFLWVISWPNIFSHSIGCLFICQRFSLQCKKL